MNETMNPPEGQFFAIDATCPGCAYPERRGLIDGDGMVFSCRECDYTSRAASEPVPDSAIRKRKLRFLLNDLITHHTLTVERIEALQLEAHRLMQRSHKMEERARDFARVLALNERNRVDDARDPEIVRYLNAGDPVWCDAVMEALGLVEGGS